jgi:hypothetical protein
MVIVEDYSLRQKSRPYIRTALRCSADALLERSRRGVGFCDILWSMGEEACRGGPRRCMAGSVSANGRGARRGDYLANGVVLVDSSYNTSFWFREMYH